MDGEENNTPERTLEDFGYQEVAVIDAAKRCGVQWTPWMGDWFNSWSPRNGNSNAEGTWEHWVVLALNILADPFTKLVMPEAAKLVEGLEIPKCYGDTSRQLTDEELLERFKDTEIW